MTENQSKFRKYLLALIIILFPLYISILVQNNQPILSCQSLLSCGSTPSKILKLLSQEQEPEFKPTPPKQFITENNQPLIRIDNNLDLPDTTNSSPEETTDQNTTQQVVKEKTLFQTILESIQGPTTGTSSGGGGNNTTPPLPPILEDCISTQTISQNINLKCYSGRRTYSTNLLTLTNTNLYKSCNAEVSLNNTSGPALINNFTSGNADFFLTLSTVSPANITLNNLPAPEKIGTWIEWNNNPLQVELINGTLQPSNITQTYTIPPNQTRNLGLVVDCGTDTLSGETGTIKIQTNFFD